MHKEAYQLQEKSAACKVVGSSSAPKSTWKAHLVSAFVLHLAVTGFDIHMQQMEWVVSL